MTNRVIGFFLFITLLYNSIVTVDRLKLAELLVIMVIISMIIMFKPICLHISTEKKNIFHTEL